LFARSRQTVHSAGLKLNPLTWLLLVSAVGLIAWLVIHHDQKQNVSSAVALVTNVPAATATISVSPAPAVSVAPAILPIETNSWVNHQPPVATNPPAADVTDDLVKLQQLGSSTNKTEALNGILPYLTNSNPQLRSMAIEAVKQVGDHSTARLLESMATNAPDEEQRTALINAAMFLYIPSLSETDKGRPIHTQSPAAPVQGDPNAQPAESQPQPDANAGGGGN
jgi:hypothetical protein